MKQVVRIAWLFSLSAQMAFVEWGSVQVFGMQAVIWTAIILTIPLALLIWLLVKGFE